ncbi:MAG: glycerophosphoryl diester phosphodiesterase membrane domain-containing protein [Solobacterium sp.]|nr:glycerophosphoryl diester phosphodiesterase membrane domain-containing protein [Solobacterium sp.]
MSETKTPDLEHEINTAAEASGVTEETEPAVSEEAVLEETAMKEPEPSGKTKKKVRKKKFNRTRRSMKLLFGDFKSLIEFEVLYRIVSLLIFYPILVYMERSILLVNRMNNMAAYNVVSSMKNPFTWIILILIALAVVFFTLIEQGGFVNAIHAVRCGKKLTANEIFFDGFDFAVDQMRLDNWMLLPFILVVLPVARIADNTSITRFFVLPGFIKEYIDKVSWLGTVVLIFTGLMIILNITWAFVFTVMGVEGKRFNASAKRSVETLKIGGVKEFLITVFGYYVSFVLSLIVLIIMIFGAWYFLCRWLEPGTTANEIFTTEVILVITAISQTTYVWIGMALFQAIVQDYYYRVCEKADIEIPEYTEHPHYLSRKPVRVLTTVISVITIYFSFPARYRQFKWMMNTSAGETMIMAHRGYSEIAPENTMPAFEAAYDAGVKAIELDVQMLKDGTIIVMHDDNFERTCGVNKNVWDATYDEVKKYDAGKLFSSEFEGTRVPTLEEVIKYCKGKLFINIEIKRNGHDEGIEKAVVDIVRAHDFIDNCDVTSQDYETLVKVKEANPDVLTAYTTVIGLGEIETLEAASIISIQETFANFENVERLHRAGKRVFVWTVNSRSAMETLVSLNVDAILTNNPELGISVLEAHQGFSDFIGRLNQILRYL